MSNKHAPSLNIVKTKFLQPKYMSCSVMFC